MSLGPASRTITSPPPTQTRSQTEGGARVTQRISGISSTSNAEQGSRTSGQSQASQDADVFTVTGTVSNMVTRTVSHSDAPRLINVDDMDKAKEDCHKNLHNRLQDTATSKGHAAYSTTFGIPLAAERALSLANQAAGGPQIITDLLNNAGPLLATAVHGQLGAWAAQRIPDNMTLQQPYSDASIKENPSRLVNVKGLAGDAFQPFITGLACGNVIATGVCRALGQAIKEIPGAEETKVGTTNAVDLAANIGIIGSLYAAGTWSARQTGRNLYGGGLSLGMSLGVPVYSSKNGEASGTIKLNQTEVILSNGEKELGVLTLLPDEKGIKHSFSVVTTLQGELKVQHTTNPVSQEEPKPAQSIRERATGFLSSLLPTRSTAIKVAALASTLSTTWAMATYVEPALQKGMEETYGYSEEESKHISNAFMTVFSSAMLGFDFIQKFKLFAHGNEDNTKFIKNLAISLTPVFGGHIAAGSSASSNVKGLTEDQMKLISENMVQVMSAISTYAKDASDNETQATGDNPDSIDENAVTFMHETGEFKINPEALMRLHPTVSGKDAKTYQEAELGNQDAEGITSAQPEQGTLQRIAEEDTAASGINNPGFESDRSPTIV